MKHPTKTPQVSDLKDQARRLRQSLADQGTFITHSRSLELLAHQYGARDWNTLRAGAATNGPKLVLSVGEPVRGKYMGQAFTGVLKAAARYGNDDAWRVSIQLDQPIDVVSFDSFSAWRHRISGTINRQGRSAQRRSDGTLHLELDWSDD